MAKIKWSDCGLTAILLLLLFVKAPMSIVFSLQLIKVDTSCTILNLISILTLAKVYFVKKHNIDCFSIFFYYTLLVLVKNDWLLKIFLV